MIERIARSVVEEPLEDGHVSRIKSAHELLTDRSRVTDVVCGTGWKTTTAVVGPK
jgi:hypothetical protein